MAKRNADVKKVDAEVEADVEVEETDEEEVENKKSDSKKGFKVQDSNGKVMPLSYETLEKAEYAAKVYGGKVVK